MSLTLTSADLRRLDACMKALLSPLDWPDPDDWRRSVNRSLRALLGTETALFVDGSKEELKVVGEELGPEQQSEFARFNFQDGGAERAVTLGLPVFNQTMIVRGDWDTYHEDEMVAEWYQPNGLRDTILCCMNWPGDESYGVIEMHASTYPSPSCDREAVAKLLLLQPAFEAGLRTAQRLVRQREELTRLLDALGDGLAVYDRDGRVAHMNAALLRLVEGDPDGARIQGELQRLARRLLRTGTGPILPEPSAPVMSILKTSAAEYRIRGCLIGEGVLHPRAGALLALERMTPEPPSREDLMERFGLSRKEAAVALLLAEGRSNREIAQVLFISPHTARHHTERVLAKLGVHSRAEAATRLLRVRSSGG